MAKIYKNLEYKNDEAGRRQKIEDLNYYSQQGWSVVSENIENGEFNGQKACCLWMMCCIPFALMAGNKTGKIRVTLEKEIPDDEPQEN